MAVSTPPEPVRVAVPGGDVAGISAAHELAGRGCLMNVYEWPPTCVGRKARSVNMWADLLLPVPPSGQATGAPLPAPSPTPRPVPNAGAAKVFQPFFTTKPTGEGTGLGLSLSHDIIAQGHGGTLTVASQPSQGTEFTLRLPA